MLFFLGSFRSGLTCLVSGADTVYQMRKKKVGEVKGEDWKGGRDVSMKATPTLYFMFHAISLILDSIIVGSCECDPVFRMDG
jgi:hypothetical protein